MLIMSGTHTPMSLVDSFKENEPPMPASLLCERLNASRQRTVSIDSDSDIEELLVRYRKIEQASKDKKAQDLLETAPAEFSVHTEVSQPLSPLPRGAEIEHRPALKTKRSEVPSMQDCLDSIPDQQVKRPRIVKGEGKRFRLCTAQLFLTYPQCQLDKEVALAALRKVFFGHTIGEYLIAQENHEGHTPDADLLRQGFKEADLPKLHEVGDKCGLHLHIYIKLEKKLDTTNVHYLDIVPPQGGKEYHGNYQGVTNRIAVLRYVTKEDTQPLANFDYEAQISSAMDHGRTPKDYSQQNAVALDSERTPLDLVKNGEIPWSSMLRLQQFRASVAQQTAMDAPRVIAFTFKVSRPWCPQSDYSLRVKFPIQREEGPSIVWLCGAGKTGKTYCARHQVDDEGAPIPYADVNTDKEFSTYKGEQLLVFNEYSGWCETTELIRMCEGEAFKVKFGFPVCIPKDVLLVVTSNRTPEEVYAKVRHEQAMHWDAFRSRVLVVEMRGANPSCPASWPNVVVDATTPVHAAAALAAPMPSTVNEVESDGEVDSAVPADAALSTLVTEEVHVEEEQPVPGVPSAERVLATVVPRPASTTSDVKRHLQAVDAKLAIKGQVRLDAFLLSKKP